RLSSVNGVQTLALPIFGRVDPLALTPESHAHGSALDRERVHNLLAIQVYHRDRADQRVRDVRAPPRGVDGDLAGRLVQLDLADRLVRLATEHRHRAVPEIDAVAAVPDRVRAEAAR